MLIISTLKGVYDECSMASRGPNINFFQQLQSIWTLLDENVYTTILDLENPFESYVEEQRVRMINLIQDDLKEGTHPREDYNELLQLTLLYLLGSS